MAHTVKKNGAVHRYVRRITESRDASTLRNGFERRQTALAPGLAPLTSQCRHASVPDRQDPLTVPVHLCNSPSARWAGTPSPVRQPVHCWAVAKPLPGGGATSKCPSGMCGGRPGGHAGTMAVKLLLSSAKRVCATKRQGWSVRDPGKSLWTGHSHAQ